MNATCNGLWWVCLTYDRILHVSRCHANIYVKHKHSSWWAHALIDANSLLVLELYNISEAVVCFLPKSPRHSPRCRARAVPPSSSERSCDREDPVWCLHWLHRQTIKKTAKSCCFFTVEKTCSRVMKVLMHLDIFTFISHNFIMIIIINLHVLHKVE